MAFDDALVAFPLNFNRVYCPPTSLSTIFRMNPIKYVFLISYMLLLGSRSAMICANFVPLIDTLPTVRILNTIHWITLVADLDMCRNVRNSNMLFKLPLREWDLCLKSDGTRHSGHCGATCKVLDLQTSITYDVVSRSRTLASILSTASFYIAYTAASTQE